MIDKELDTLMAEKVMGWSVNEYGTIRNQDNNTIYWKSCNEQLEPSRLFTPTTDMNLAMDCVDGFGTEHHFNMFWSNHYKGWCVEFELGEIVVHDPSAPLAICLALAKAIK